MSHQTKQPIDSILLLETPTYWSSGNEEDSSPVAIIVQQNNSKPFKHDSAKEEDGVKFVENFK